MTMESARPGFALPTVFLLTLFMTAGLMAAFARTSAEVRVVDHLRAETAAFAIAQGGLDRYLAKVGQLGSTDTTFTFQNGTARVRATVIRSALKPTDTAIYVIRSEASVSGGGATVPKGKRVVAQLAYRIQGYVPVTAIWTSPGGLVKSGSSGTITGEDGCTGDIIAGVSTPDGLYTQSGDGKPVSGDPPFLPMGTQEQMIAQMKQMIDWAAITNPAGSSLTTDVIVCYPGTTGYNSSRGPCGSWPSSTAWNNPDFWPTIIVNGSVTDVPNNGRGVLVVTGNLTLGGGDSWNGILMVGNSMDDNGQGSVQGAVFSGLNVLKGEAVAVSASKADGTKDYAFNSCSVTAAANRQSRWNQIPNAWVDNMSTW